MNGLIETFVALRRWAVVGASQERHKYGNIILRNLHQAGYEVVGVHPLGKDIGTIAVYPTLADISPPPEVVDIVVPPHVTMEIVEQCHELGLRRVWMQPGSESEEAVQFCRAHAISLIANGPCAMVHKRHWRD